MTTTRAYMTVDLGPSRLGTLELVLYADDVPRTVRNFETLLQRGGGKGYSGCPFHRIIRGFMAQGGDFTNGNGTGGESIYGPSFEDENFIHRHDNRGKLSMANSGPDTNGSQFFITFRPTPHLDGRHVVFGHVDLTKSAAVLDAMERVATGENDVPLVDVTISDCGLVLQKVNENQGDKDEIDLDELDNDAQDPQKSELPPQTRNSQEHPGDEDEEIDLPDEGDEGEEGSPAKPKSKAQALRDRLKKLKMKVNQARQLNRQEVMREGERLGSMEGMAKERKRQAVHDKKLRDKEWEKQNAKALQIAADAGVSGKLMVEPAVESIKKAITRADKAEASRFGVNDYYNPEGQHRNYERNLKSLPSHAALDRSSIDSSSTFNPILAASTGVKEEAEERQGARRLANELKKRIEKQAKKRDRLEFDATDVSYINERNKRFNKKISRNFDQHTAEIRQNLERGTAL